MGELSLFRIFFYKTFLFKFRVVIPDLVLFPPRIV